MATTTHPEPPPAAITTTELAQVLRLVLPPADADSQLARISFAYAGRPEAERTALAAVAQRAATAVLRASLLDETNNVRPECGDAMRAVCAVWDNEHAGDPGSTRILSLAFDALIVSDAARTYAQLANHASDQKAFPMTVLGPAPAAQPGDLGGDKLASAAALAAQALQSCLLLSHMDTANPDAPVNDRAVGQHLATAVRTLDGVKDALIHWGYPRGYVKDHYCDDEGCPGGPHIG